MMRKRLVIGGVAVGAALLARRCAASCSGLDFEKMIERMPENAPRKWMFRNINAIRENTERILRLLETERLSAASDSSRTAA